MKLRHTYRLTPSHPYSDRQNFYALFGTFHFTKFILLTLFMKENCFTWQTPCRHPPPRNLGRRTYRCMPSHPYTDRQNFYALFGTFHFTKFVLLTLFMKENWFTWQTPCQRLPPWNLDRHIYRCTPSHLYTSRQNFYALFGTFHPTTFALLTLFMKDIGLPDKLLVNILHYET